MWECWSRSCAGCWLSVVVRPPRRRVAGLAGLDSWTDEERRGRRGWPRTLTPESVPRLGPVDCNTHLTGISIISTYASAFCGIRSPAAPSPPLSVSCTLPELLVCTFARMSCQLLVSVSMDGWKSTHSHKRLLSRDPCREQGLIARSVEIAMAVSTSLSATAHLRKPSVAPKVWRRSSRAMFRSTARHPVASIPRTPRRVKAGSVWPRYTVAAPPNPSCYASSYTTLNRTL